MTKEDFKKIVVNWYNKEIQGLNEDIMEQKELVSYLSKNDPTDKEKKLIIFLERAQNNLTSEIHGYESMIKNIKDNRDNIIDTLFPIYTKMIKIEQKFTPLIIKHYAGKY